VEVFELAMARTKNPSTKTRGATSVKTETRVAAEDAIKQFYPLIQANRRISNKDKIGINVKLIRKKRARVACPSRRPDITVVVHPSCQHILRFKDGNAIGKAKPAGAIALQVFVALTDAAVTDPSQAHFLMNATRNPTRIQHQRKDEGKVATYFARWISRRGETGPWSLAATCRVAT
jgi:hypothetical protein